MRFNDVSIKWKILFLALAAPLIIAIIMAWRWTGDIRREAEKTVIDKSKAVVLMAEATRNEMSRKLNLGVMKPFDQLDPSIIIEAVPVVTAMQTAAINAGFKYAHGSVVITMDGDLQNDPADIPRLLQKMSEGYDLVSGWRKDRHDKFLTRRVPSAIANMMINKLIAGTGIRLNDFGCTLKAYKKGVVKNINLYGEMHRFIPVFAAWLGVQVAEVEVNHRHRVFGKAKYNLSRVSRVVFDLIVVRFFSDYMTRPIQFFGKVAKKLGLLGFLSLLTLSLLTIFTTINISVNTILILGGLLLFAILQILSMGLLGEIMTRTYFEGQKKDYYVVEKIINDEDVM